jgi:hypothetical protein
MARCCMIDTAEGGVGRASEDGEMRVRVQMQTRWEVLSWGGFVWYRDTEGVRGVA